MLISCLCTVDVCPPGCTVTLFYLSCLYTPRPASSHANNYQELAISPSDKSTNRTHLRFVRWPSTWELSKRPLCYACCGHVSMDDGVSAGPGSCMCGRNGSKIGAQPHVLHDCSCRCIEAAETEDLHFLQSKYTVHQLGYAQLAEISYVAARGGQLKMLQWLCHQGVPPCNRMCSEAASGAHLAVLQ